MKKLNINLTGKNRQIPALFVVAAVILAVIAGITFARYVLQKEHSGVAEAEAFYFTSDLLKDESENKSYHIDPETKSFEITISNAADSKRITQADIEFKVNVEGGTVNETDANFTLTGNNKTERKIIIIPDKDANLVTVTATSDKPYKKTLKAAFELAAGNQYKIEDASGNRAAVLTITCINDMTEGITINVPANIIPDATNTLITKKEDGTYKLAAAKAGVYSLVLLKKNVNRNISKPESEFTDTITIPATP